MYVATNHLEVSSDLYTVRALPDDARYSHAFIILSQANLHSRQITNVKREASLISSTSSHIYACFGFK